MSRKLRLAVVFVIIEAGLAGLWWWLASYGMQNPDRVAPDFQQTIGQTIGTVMGALAGVSLVLFFVAARNDRKAAEDRARR